ncbi:MAG: hypothetical protein OEX12_16050 [Gammaproteobacteria bacterium]|nr:hypothetical protein [Gammaproteobacteria bacterium]
MTDNKQVTVKTLANIIIPHKVVDLGDGQGFKVTGLSIKQLIDAFVGHYELLDGLMEGEFEGIGRAVLESPEVVSRIIALAAGDEENYEIVMQMPTQIQGMALMAVFELTFPDTNTLGKWWARLEGLVGNLSHAYKKAISKGEKIDPEELRRQILSGEF